LSRAAGYIPGGEGLAKFLDKKYADYQNMTPDGSIPVYSSQGSLVQYASPTQIMAKATGLGDVQGVHEQELTNYLSTQMKQIQGLKRQFLDAVYQGDTKAALQIQETYDQRYPGTGGLPVSDRDIRTLHRRRDVTRIERVLETMSPELRPMFTDVINTTFGAQAPELLGLAEQLRGDQTIQMREPYRRIPQEQMTGRMNQGLHAVKLRDKIGLRGRVAQGRARNRMHYYGTQTYYPVGTTD
jgi:hypothetical protein